MIYENENYITDFNLNSYAILGAIFSLIFFILFFVFFLYIFKMIYNYFLFKKMGRKGWEGIIPIYNVFVKLKVLDIPLWLILFYFIPGASIVLYVVIAINMGIKFQKDTFFIIGLVFLPIVFCPILAFGKSEFNKEIVGIFEDDKNKDDTFSYCTNCGTKLNGTYCYMCGKKSD